MRDDPEFRLKRDVALAPQANAGRASPVARRRRSVDVRRSGGRLANKKTHSLKAHRECKLGSAPPPYIKSEVPPADQCSEVAIAAPSPANAPMEPWLMDVENNRQDGCFGCELTKAKSKLRMNEALRMRELRRTQRRTLARVTANQAAADGPC